MDERGEKFWSLAQEMVEEIPRVRDRHAQQMKMIAEMEVEMDMLKMKTDELAGSLMERNKEIKESRTKMEDFVQLLAEKNKQIDDVGRKAQALTQLLWEKNKELEAVRRKAEADTMQLEEAHRLETDAVRSQAQQTEADYHRATLERFRRTLQEKEARNNQLEKELLETRLMAGETNMVPTLPKDPSSVPLEMPKMHLQNSLASEEESTSHSGGGTTEDESKQDSQNKPVADHDRGRNLSTEFSESALPDRVESYEIMKARGSEVEGVESNGHNGNRESSRQPLKQTNPKPVVPLRRKQRFLPNK